MFCTRDWWFYYFKIFISFIFRFGGSKPYLYDDFVGYSVSALMLPMTFYKTWVPITFVLYSFNHSTSSLSQIPFKYVSLRI